MLDKQRIQDIALSLYQEAPVKASFLDPWEAAQIIDYFRQNKVPLLELSRRRSVSEVCSKGLAEAMQRAADGERDHLLNWCTSYTRINVEWAKAGIESIFHKSFGQFPYLSDNLDILVRAGDFSSAAAILRQMGYVELRNVQEAHKLFFRKFEGTEQWAPIHLHERVCWDVPYEDNVHVWENSRLSREDADVRYPGPEDSIMITTAHCFLEDHLIKLSDLWALKKCLGQGAVDWAYIAHTAEMMHWDHALWTGFLICDRLFLGLFGEHLFPRAVMEKANAFVSSRRWIERTMKSRLWEGPFLMPFKIPHLWTRRHSSLRIISDPSLGSRSFRYSCVALNLLNGLLHSKLGFQPHPKMHIVFCGLDGSGKTRHSRTLQKAFLSCGINSRVVWSRAGSLPLARFLLGTMRMMKVNYQRPSRDRRKGGEAAHGHGGIRLFLWSAVNGLDLVLHNIFRVALPLFLGRLIISDRSIHDSLVDLESLRETANLKRPFYRLIRSLTPSPDLLLFLDVKPDVIKKRGGDDDRSDLEKRYQLYRGLKELPGAILVDNSRDFRGSNAEIARVSLETFFRKYPDKYKGYRLVSLRY